MGFSVCGVWAMVDGSVIPYGVYDACFFLPGAAIGFFVPMGMEQRRFWLFYERCHCCPERT